MTTADELLAGRRRVTLMRHGEASYFDAQRRPINPRSVPLTARGRTQAMAAGQVLADVHFDRIVCSGMPRTRETAALVCGDETRVEDMPGLTEVRGGRLRDIADEHLHKAMARPYDGADQPGASFMGGERFEAVRARVLEVWEALLADDGPAELLIVAHDAVNRIILSEVCAAGLAGMAAFEQDPGCINLIDVQRDYCYLRAVNLTPWDWAKRECRLTSMEPVYLQYLSTRRGAAVN